MSERRRKSIRELRARAGLTQRELAEKIGTDQGTISGYETGRIIPTGPRLQDLANALDCSANVIALRPLRKRMVAVAQ